MPHYKDGTEAMVGDLVKGKPYNTAREVVGEIVQITPGAESCNCVVAFAETSELGSEELSAGHYTFHGNARRVRVAPKYDYGETKAFEKVDGAGSNVPALVAELEEARAALADAPKAEQLAEKDASIAKLTEMFNASNEENGKLRAELANLVVPAAEEKPVETLPAPSPEAKPEDPAPENPPAAPPAS